MGKYPCAQKVIGSNSKTASGILGQGTVPTHCSLLQLVYVLNAETEFHIDHTMLWVDKWTLHFRHLTREVSVHGTISIVC